MMKTHQERVFRIPIEELRTMLESEYGVDLSEVEPYLEKDSVAFAIGVEDSRPTGRSNTVVTSRRAQMNSRKSRRPRKRRNRVKTRGWSVVGKITNSKGLTANVYEPFVQALKGLQITRSEQKKMVRQIMVANGNNPTDESVEYFLSNTVEFLSQSHQAEG